LLSRWNKRLHGKFTPAMNNKKTRRKWPFVGENFVMTVTL